jgi:hypothetical protein
LRFVSAFAFVALLGCSTGDGASNGENEADGGGSSSTRAPGSSTLGPVGAACSTGDTQFTGFNGYGSAEVVLGTDSPTCESTLCLVNHFQGYPSCPYGQSSEDIYNLPEDSPERCHAEGGEVVPDSVEPQLLNRREEDTVYCSCRCDGSDPGAARCDCPSGFECVPLVDDLGFDDSDEFAGSYCVKEGTIYDPDNLQTETCERSLENCE